MGNFDIGELILYMVAILFSLSVHETGHAWVSNHFGDDLAKSQGRISLNPLVHIDPLGTLLFPILAFTFHLPIIGWAKPVPVNPLRWKEQRKANFWVAIAGILGNLLIALGATLAFRLMLGVMGREGIAANDTLEVLYRFIHLLFLMNIGLAVFNLVPIPPLDGSKIIASFLPGGFYGNLHTIEALGSQYGIILLYGAMYLGVFRAIFGFIYPFANGLFYLGTGLQ